MKCDKKQIKFLYQKMNNEKIFQLFEKISLYKKFWRFQFTFWIFTCDDFGVKLECTTVQLFKAELTFL